MKVLFFTIASLLAVCTSAVATKCYLNAVSIPTDWVTMQNSCRKNMYRQIQIEVSASLQYLAMGAYFSRDTINRPGFAELFFDAAGEERQLAMKLIEYLLMRGELTNDVSNLIRIRPTHSRRWENGVEALEYALKMEGDISKSISEVIKVCEDNIEFNGYNLVDYLSDEFMVKLSKRQRDFAGKISTLKTMLGQHPALGEFIFDKKLLGIDF